MANVTLIVTETTSESPIVKALVTVNEVLPQGALAGAGPLNTTTDASGICNIELSPGDYSIDVEAFEVVGNLPLTVKKNKLVPTQELSLDLGLEAKVINPQDPNADFCTEGDVLNLEFSALPEILKDRIADYVWVPGAGAILELPANRFEQPPKLLHWDTSGVTGITSATVTIFDDDGTSVSDFAEINVREGSFVQQTKPEVSVSLRRASIPESDDQALWVAIRNRTNAINFNTYSAFVDKVLCNDDGGINAGLLDGRNDKRLVRQNNELYNPIHGVGAYELLKTATQVFLLLECGVAIEEVNRYTGKPLFNSLDEASRLGRNIPIAELKDRLTRYLGFNRLPYIQTVLENAFKEFSPTDSIFCSGFLTTRADCPPLLELIWSYWHEEAMLAQTMNAISLRFQNRRGAVARDPLAQIEIAPLFPINNLIWGYIQDEQQRLSVPRRAYEYDHHYGLTLAGKAVPDFRPVDTRSKFLEAYHHLLYLCTVFYKQDDDTTVIADGFPVLNALKEVHLLLAEGAHNQFGDLPWTSRAEMLTEQWILSRPEMRQFLLSRHMVPYREAWMGQVDTMKRIQGWTDVTTTHFNELAIYGEQILLSVRYGNWNIDNNPAQAANWARYWRPEIQNYIHSYRAVTGVELRAEPTTNQQRQLVTTLPTVLIQQRLLSGKSAPALPAPMVADAAKSFRERRTARRQGNG